MKIQLKDGVANLHEIEIPSEPDISALLRLLRIPPTSVDLRPGKSGNAPLGMNRSYDLLSLIDALTPQRDRPHSNAYYQKCVLEFDKGEVGCKMHALSEQTFEEYVVRSVLESLQDYRMVEKGDAVFLGFSGGKDSLSLLRLFYQLRDQVPNHSLIPVTLHGIPEWDDIDTGRIAARACKDLHTERIVVEESAIRRALGLKFPLPEVLQRIENAGSAHQAIFVGHHVIRRMLEITAEKHARVSVKICLGLNMEDILASILGSYTSGVFAGDLPARRLGQFTYIFPLWSLPKREVNLYCDSHQLSGLTQGPHTHFNLGPMTRALHYYLCDVLEDVWPGIIHHMLFAYRKIWKQLAPSVEYETCRRCGCTFLIFESKRGICDVCELLDQTGC